MKEIRNTIDGVEITNKRRDGNSTRQIDAAIKLLFNGYKVEVRDHFMTGKCEESNKSLFYQVIRRLEVEHRSPVLKIDKKNFTIELV